MRSSIRLVTALGFLAAAAALIVVPRGAGGALAAQGTRLGDRGPDRPFRVAKIPYVGSRDLYREYRGFLDDLARQLHVDKATLVLASDYNGIVQKLEAGEADCAWMGTLSYALARQRGVPLVPLVCPIRSGGKSYRGVVFARRDAGIHRLRDFDGKSFAFVDPDSASGFLFPKVLLESSGVDVPGGLHTSVPGEPDFLGNHSNVVLNVLLGKFDGGAVYEGALEGALTGQTARLSELRIVARTQPIFGEPIVVLESMPLAERRHISRAFLALKASEGFSLEDIRGFARVEDRDYDFVRRMTERLQRARR